MSSRVKRTYGSRPKVSAPFPPSSPVSVPSSPPPPHSKKRSLPSTSNGRPAKKVKLAQPKQKTLTQLHFCVDKPTLRKCSACNMSYTKGAEEDEALHRTHCAKVKKGMEWGREEEKEDVVEVESRILLKGGKKGRIVCIRADATGRIGSKLNTLYEMIDMSLSAPPLSDAVLRKSKVYLFLLPVSSATASSSKERIAGCVIAQHISTAMEVAPSAQQIDEKGPSPELVLVDSSSGVFCYPTPLPTSLGVPRIFVPTADRRQGIACKLLSAAAKTFIHGCELDPRKGHVAFSQTTGDGLSLMREWGGGGVRIYDEDQ
ncbi:hypothetical protein AAF712_002468 [Marasmius tenuissimus]|uniref:N-acetyltransferase ECO1 n=1 Tax=Marasmius tenuissimus TaxID=585030 RepID=A0ABR3AAR6_9AGAR